MERQARMRVLAEADAEDLRRRWPALGLDPAFRPVRGPEAGLATVRGRISGDGAPFNVGDVTVTRATVRLEDGAVGHGWRLGRDKAAAQIAAVIDALSQNPINADRIDTDLIAPLQTLKHERDSTRRSETAATRVDFFTLVRGED